MIEVVARAGVSPAKAAAVRLLAAKGAWVALEPNNPLVRSAQTRRYWARKLGGRVEVGRDSLSGALFARLVGV